MAVNLIVVAVTILLLGFIIIWLGWPSCRPWFEAPKFPPARWDDTPATSRRALCSDNFSVDEHTGQDVRNRSF
jgi:hypothetical protein